MENFSISPINAQRENHHFFSSRPATVDGGFIVPARSPLAAIENLEKPLAVEEDVVVMDGILVGTRGKTRASSPRVKITHRKEKLRSSRFPNKNTSEPKICKFTSPRSCSQGANFPFAHHLALNSECPTYVRPIARQKLPEISPMKIENIRKIYSRKISSTLTRSDWSPVDDGIDISLNKNPSREAANAYIKGALYGPSPRKKLPVFAEICPPF